MRRRRRRRAPDFLIFSCLVVFPYVRREGRHDGRGAFKLAILTWPPMRVYTFEWMGEKHGGPCCDGWWYYRCLLVPIDNKHYARVCAPRSHRTEKKQNKTNWRIERWTPGNPKTSTHVTSFFFLSSLFKTVGIGTQHTHTNLFPCYVEQASICIYYNNNLHYANRVSITYIQRIRSKEHNTQAHP